jgi:hypothetical protein
MLHALRLLWARRLGILIGAVLALVAGYVLGRSSAAPSGIAKTSVMVDTVPSEIAAGDPRGANTLFWRATLMAMLLGTGPSRAQMAAELHIPAAQLAVSDTELTVPAAPASLPTAAIQAATQTTEPYVLTVYTDDVEPIISIEAAAPNRGAATQLARAAVSTLQLGTPTRSTHSLQGMTVAQIGSINARELPGSTGRMKMAIVAIVVFALWCLGLAIPRRLIGSRARASTAPAGAL